MRRILCFIFGIVVGAVCVLFSGNYLNDIDIREEISVLLEKITDSSEDGYEKEDPASNDFDYESDLDSQEEFIDITPHLNLVASIGDDIGFSGPSEDLIDPNREGDNIIYDMQDNGKGVLINYYGIGMQKVMADVFITSDYGESWDVIQRGMTFLSGTLDVLYMGDTIVIISSFLVVPDTTIYISNNNGRDFDCITNDEYRFAQFIGEPSESFISAAPIFLSKNEKSNTVLCAWFRSDTWETKSSDLLLISEHDVTTFEITKEFYRNNTTIAETVSEYS